MRTLNPEWLLALAGAIALMGCAAADKPPAAATQSPQVATNPEPVAASAAEGEIYRGWYLEHDGQGMFQPCGQSQQWRVESPELRVQAKDFGLDPDTPIYVHVSATLSDGGDELSVSRVDQFGSPTPVRDCAMTGVVMPTPTDG